MSDADQQRQIDELQSRVAIGDLVSKYCFGCDGRDIEKWNSIWHEDAVYDIGEAFGEFSGSSGVEEAARTMWAALNFTRHWTTNLVIDFDGSDRATGRCDVCFDCEDAEGRLFFGAASYNDVFERRDGAWKISRREVVIHHRKVVEAPEYV